MSKRELGDGEPSPPPCKHERLDADGTCKCGWSVVTREAVNSEKRVCPKCNRGMSLCTVPRKEWRCLFCESESGAAQEVSPPIPEPSIEALKAERIAYRAKIAEEIGGDQSQPNVLEIRKLRERAEKAEGDTRELKAALRKHQQFVGLVLDSQVPEPGDLDGFSIEEIAIKCGFYVPTPVTEPCHEEACVCAEFGFPTTCNRWSESAQEAVKVAEAEKLLG